MINSIAQLRGVRSYQQDKRVLIKDSFVEYRFDADSMEVDDGDNVIKPSSVLLVNPGRWIRQPDAGVPGVGAWEIVFTRKVADEESDYGPVATGIVYDPDYEYLTATYSNTNPTLEITAAASIDAMETSGISNGVAVAFRPNGYDILGSPLKTAIVKANQAIFGGLQVSLGDVNCSLILEDDGEFYTEYGNNPDSDFFAVIARRRRYG